ncbi:MAG: endolytic transglycosylase MltG [Bacteroidales bacterium]|nr:endolytic transglycosylase MltG [Bacteroidales bacterium]MBN2697583.1 endolytic transglycosylase MltG [Bacteroidales bacterium]
MALYERRRRRTSTNIIRGSVLFVFLGLIILVIVIFKFYGRIFEPNVSLDEAYVIFYVGPGSDYETVLGNLADQDILINQRAFDWIAEKKEYPSNIKPGRYRITDGMTNNELVNMLRSGKQDPVMVVFNNVRTLEELAGKVSGYILPDSAEIAAFLADPAVAERYGFTEKNFSSMFIPNTYEFYWTADPEDFTDRMKSEYERFWEGERDRKAGALEMTRTEVITLASIVDEETLHDEENARIAGVYLNRLEQGIPLQADPTLRFALGDFTRKRILNQDKNLDSPYNTYKFKGLPPGPISIPSISAIDGVLNYEKHNYLFFCAKDDFSGYHAFARTLAQHNRNARAYQSALNKASIYR